MYRREVCKVSKETWRTFCGSINDLPRLHRALSRDPKTKLGSLVAPTRECTQSKGETLDLLLATHFPDSDAVEGGGGTRRCPPCHRRELVGGCQDYHLSQGGVGDWFIRPVQKPTYGWYFLGSLARGSGDPYSVPD